MHRYGPQALSPPRTPGPRAHSATVPSGGNARRAGRLQTAAHVVCLHASASSGRQWRALQTQLGGGYQVQSPSSTRAVARLLTQTLPNVTSAELTGAGHMAPLTHPGMVNAAIQEHLRRAP